MLDVATADAIAARVNCYGIGEWMKALFHQLDENVPESLANERVTVEMPRHGLSLVLYRRDAIGGPNGIVLDRAQFDGRPCSLPFALDATTTTPAIARTKLSTDTVRSGQRTSYFLDDGRVVELTFQPNDRGITRVLVARLGPAMLWTDSVSP